MLRNFKIIRPFLQAGQTIWCLLANFENFGKLVSSVQGGKIVWCLLSTVAKLSGVFCPRWKKGVVSFVHPGKNSLVSFGSGVFCLAPKLYYLCSENKGADQLRSHCAADLRLCFRICKKKVFL